MSSCATRVHTTCMEDGAIYLGQLQALWPVVNLQMVVCACGLNP